MINVLLIITSIMITMISAWSISTFIKLKNASKKYESDTTFESSCIVTKQYVNIGLYTGIITLILSFLLLITTCMIVYKNYS